MSSLSPINQFYQALLEKKVLGIKPNFFRQRYLKIYWLRRIIETFFVAALINTTQTFSLSTGSESTLSPATGIALAALFLRGRTMLVGIFLGTFISHLIHHVPAVSSFFYGVCFTLYIFLIREICLRWVGPILPLNKISIFIKFLLICAILSIGYLFLLKFIFTPNINLLSRWLSEINGILYLVPLCFLFDPYSPETLFNKKQKKWWLSTIGLLILQLLLLFIPAKFFIMGSLFMLTGILAYAYYFPPITVGITLLCLSAFYIGLNISTPVIFVLQAMLGLAFSLKRKS